MGNYHHTPSYTSQDWPWYKLSKKNWKLKISSSNQYMRKYRMLTQGWSIMPIRKEQIKNSKLGTSLSPTKAILIDDRSSKEKLTTFPKIFQALLDYSKNRKGGLWARSTRVLQDIPDVSCISCILSKKKSWANKSTKTLDCRGQWKVDVWLSNQIEY